MAGNADFGAQADAGATGDGNGGGGRFSDSGDTGHPLPATCKRVFPVDDGVACNSSSIGGHAAVNHHFDSDTDDDEDGDSVAFDELDAALHDFGQSDQHFGFLDSIDETAYASDIGLQLPNERRLGDFERIPRAGLRDGDVPQPPDVPNPPGMRSSPKFVPGQLCAPGVCWRWLHRIPNLSRQVFDWLQNHIHFELSSDEPFDLSNNYAAMSEEELDAFAAEAAKGVELGTARVWDGSAATRPRFICRGRVTPKRVAAGQPKKWRLIHNAIPINRRLLQTWGVSYEGFRHLQTVCQPGWFMFSIDLVAGYSQLLVRDPSMFGMRIPLRGSCDSSGACVVCMLSCCSRCGVCSSCSPSTPTCGHGAEQLISWQTLVFGMSPACSIFSKIMRGPTQLFRRRGFNCLHYLDDWIFFAPTLAEACHMRDEVIAVFRALRIQVNFEKSQLVPSQIVEWCGNVISLEHNRLFVPQRKLDELMLLLQSLRDGPSMVVARRLASVAGRIISMARCLVPSRLMTRSLFAAMRCKTDGDWDSLVELIPSAADDIAWWIDNLLPWAATGCDIFPDSRPVDLRIVGDGSPLGFGAFIDGRDAASGQFSLADLEIFAAYSAEEAVFAQSHRELLAVLRVFENLAESSPDLISGRRLVYITDCIAVRASINNGGSPRPVLNELSRQIWGILVQHQSSLACRWVHGTTVDAVGVDALSRSALQSETWQLLDPIMAQLQAAVGVSGAVIPSAAFHDRSAFGYSWSELGHSVAAFPGCHRVSEAIAFLKSMPVSAVLVVPRWISAPFWPVIQRFASRVVELGNANRVFRVRGSARLPRWRFVLVFFSDGCFNAPLRGLDESPPGLAPDRARGRRKTK